MKLSLSFFFFKETFMTLIKRVCVFCGFFVFPFLSFSFNDNNYKHPDHRGTGFTERLSVKESKRQFNYRKQKEAVFT